MGRLMISSSQMCISREQEEFLAAYRTDEARQAFIDSYGKEKVNFFDLGYGENSNKTFDGVLLEYFSYFDGNGRCWFDLDVDIQNPNLSISFGFRVNQVLAAGFNKYLFGFPNFTVNTNSFLYSLWVPNGNMFAFNANVYDTSVIIVGVPEGFLFKYYDVVLNNPLHSAIFNNDIYNGIVSSGGVGSGSLTLFVDAGGRNLSCDFYYLTIRDSGNIIRDMVPVMHGDRVALYDFVTQRFFDYQGMGFFTAGPIKNN